MLSAGASRVWRSIDYAPAIPAHLPVMLADTLRPGASILEIGCNAGAVSCWLARHERRFRVHGIDVHSGAIAEAQRRAHTDGAPATFEIADALQYEPTARYDAIVAIRVLTCFPDAREWRALIDNVFRLLAPRGVWYVVDYVFDPSNAAYSERYADGARRGWRAGNFLVRDAAGRPMFIAHHHTVEELRWLENELEEPQLRRFTSLSMHGNPAALFELCGRRAEVKP